MRGLLLRRWFAPPIAAVAFAFAFACGDLVIPSNGENPSGDGSAGLADGPIDGHSGLVPPNCDAGVYPVALACTGLYSNWTLLTIAPDVRPYHPGATLWADGASSTEWVWLPPGAKIDTSDLNDWVFPVGTKFWQQLTLLGARIETRFLWKMGAGQWFRATYAWTADESSAPELTTGSANVGGLPYDIPSVAECDQCHDGASDFVLGFEIVGLALPASSGLNLQTLVQQSLLSKPPTAAVAVPGGDPATTGALTFLHANCGTACHNRNADANAGQTGLFLKLLVDASGGLPATADATDTWMTAVNVPSSFTPAGVDAGGFWRIRPGDVPHSMIPFRASRRNTPAQMPPIATELVDQNDVVLLEQWVAAVGAGAPLPPPGAADAAADR